MHKSYTQINSKRDVYKIKSRPNNVLEKAGQKSVLEREKNAHTFSWKEPNFRSAQFIGVCV